MTLWSWSQVYDAPMTNAVTPEAIPVINRTGRRVYRAVLRCAGPARAIAGAGSRVPEGRQRLRGCALGHAAREQYSGDTSACDPDLSGPGGERSSGASQDHARLHGKAVQGGKRGADVLDAECRACLRGTGQRFGRQSAGLRTALRGPPHPMTAMPTEGFKDIVPISEGGSSGKCRQLVFKLPASIYHLSQSGQSGNSGFGSRSVIS